MKIVAFYLPQFHEIPENNKWWGQGFTEWTNVKKAHPLFSGHSQPRVPMNNEYYDLSDVDVLKKQSILAKKFGVDAFCFYHYWFDGKLLLEKPLNNLLNNKDIDLEFCLSWANEPWARTWDGKDKDVLIAQKYGNENEWSEHFEFLLRFFSDERYIKVDGKPMLVIYKTKDIPNADNMISHWNLLAVKNGFSKGLYIVETLGGKQSSPCLNNSSALVEFEPSLSMGIGDNKMLWIWNKLKMALNKGLYRINYKTVMNNSINRKSRNDNKDAYLGCFTGWDNTPRKGRRGVVFDGANPALFEEYLSMQIKKSNENGFLFINAWNEWAEGAYLEPDEHFGFSYLEAVRNARKASGI